MINPESQDALFISENLKFWNDLTGLQKQMLLTYANSYRIDEGIQLIRSSTECQGMILIKSGRIRAFLTSENGKEITLFRLLPEDSCIMTASCMIEGVRFQIFLEAEKEVEMYLIPQTVFIRLNSENSVVKDYTMNALASKFSEALSIVDSLVFASVPSRIAQHLIEMLSFEDSMDNTVHTTHDNIAKNIGSVREVVSRILKGLERDGILSLSRNQIIVKDIKRLYDLTQY